MNRLPLWDKWMKCIQSDAAHQTLLFSFIKNPCYGIIWA